MTHFGNLVTRLYTRLDGAQWMVKLAVRIAEVIIMAFPVAGPCCR